jgi:ribonucleoside-diphosphate reductase alpha chain
MDTKKLNQYEQMSFERKALQAEGLAPPWMATAGYQMFKEKYQYQAANPREQFMRIAVAAAVHAPNAYTPYDLKEGNDLTIYLGLSFKEYWTSKFFHVLWKGYLCCSTPVLANMGTDRASPVSCAGSVMSDSVEGFYSGYRELAVLTKENFGTATDLSDVRCRGSKISVGGKASGIMPVVKHIVQDSRDVSQGQARRGAVAIYLKASHGDFWELCEYMDEQPDDLNVGWIITDEFIEKLDDGDDETLRRFRRMMKLKMVFGKGYFFFIDKVNRARPDVYKERGLMVRASQLCSEIFLHSDKDHTYTCILSWMNLSLSDEWDKTDAAFVGTVFLDCVTSEFIIRGSKIPGLEKAVLSTIKGRAIGLGAGGFHTYLQRHRMSWGGIEAHLYNGRIFKHISNQSLEASKWLATLLGEPEWCKGSGLRFTHRMAIAPTKSTALIYGGISEGINPDMALTFMQLTAAGEVHRINPAFLDLLREKGMDVKAALDFLVQSQGSCQGMPGLSEEDMLVFMTAFEVNPYDILRLGINRMRQGIDQGQSLNLYFSGSSSEQHIAEVHQYAFMQEELGSLYYVYSTRGVVSSSSECVACM